jgi:intergrase/recombinase
MAKLNSVDELNQRQQQLKAKIKQLLDLLIGSVVSYQMKCGKKNCKCAQGERHICFYLSYKKQGKTVNSYVPKHLVDKARSMTDNHKELKQVLAELSEVNLELLRQSDKLKKSRSTKPNQR